MDRQIDGPADGKTDGKTHTDRQTDAQTGGQTQMNRQTDRRADRRTVGQSDRRTYRQMDTVGYLLSMTNLSRFVKGKHKINHYLICIYVFKWKCTLYNFMRTSLEFSMVGKEKNGGEIKEITHVSKNTTNKRIELVSPG